MSWPGLLILVASACAGSIADPGASQSEEAVYPGSWYVRIQWPHDGNPHQSDHFVVYSDGAGPEARVVAADTAETALAETMSEMGVTWEMLRLPPGQDRIDIYAFKNQSPDWAGKAYWGGLAIFSPDHEDRSASGQTGPEVYPSYVKHELVHVLTESLVRSGGLANPAGVDAWFSEGLAEALSGGTAAGAIRGKDHLDDLTERYGQLNPVSYETDDGVEGGAGAFSDYHYPMRQLAVEYLLDEKGLGRTPRDATALWLDVARGTDFATAFEAHMGIRLAHYEEQFFELMADYLPEHAGSVALGSTGLTLISTVTIGVALVGSIGVVRSSPMVTVGPGPTEPRPTTRSGRIGFAGWIATFSIISLALYLAGMAAMGRTRALGDSEKTIGLVILTAFLAGSTALLTWALRRRRLRSPIAWVIPPLTLAAAGGTILVFQAVF